MRVGFLMALACAGCSAQTDGTKQTAEKSAEPPACTIQMASKPPVARTFDEIQSATDSVLCEGAASLSGQGKLAMNSVPLEIGAPIADVENAARRAGARVIDTYAGRAFVFEREFPPPPNSFSSLPRKETRRFWFNSENQKLVGFRVCENFESGHYANGPNAEYAAAVGAPNTIETVSEGPYATGLRMVWRNGTRLEVHGSPNTARLDVGKISPRFSWSDDATNTRLFRDLVKREDRRGREFKGLARIDIAQENCLTSNELEGVVVPLLNANVSPDG